MKDNIVSIEYEIKQADGTVKYYTQQRKNTVYINHVIENVTGEQKLMIEGTFRFELNKEEYEDFMDRLSKYVILKEEEEV